MSEFGPERLRRESAAAGIGAYLDKILTEFAKNAGRAGFKVTRETDYEVEVTKGEKEYQVSSGDFRAQGHSVAMVFDATDGWDGRIHPLSILTGESQSPQRDAETLLKQLVKIAK